LKDAYVSAAVRCAPPANKPTTEERDTCLPYLRRELALLTDVQVVVVLGQFAYDVMTRELGIKPKPKFGHGVEVDVPAVDTERRIICSFHPSQQNTFTRKLTEEMFDAIFQRTRALTSPTR
jgi:uracil-DNA glycosylase family 4